MHQPICARVAAPHALAMLALATFSCTPGAAIDPDGGADASLTRCVTDDDCVTDFCDGDQRCIPDAEEADARGCVLIREACMVGEICDAAMRRCVRACGSERDADGDGVDALECGGTDCDDHDPGRFSGNVEVCDAAHVDEDCDPTTLGDRDDDRDGEVDAACCNTGVDGELRCGEDCDDSRANVSRTTVEVCDGVDNDCDPATFAVGEDDDHDGFADVGCGGSDCDDECPTCRPEASDELCDGLDQDCDGSVDEALDPALFTTFYVDSDGDGLGDASMSDAACVVPSGHSTNATDCNDGDARVGACSAPLRCVESTTCGCTTMLLNNAQWLDLDTGNVSLETAHDGGRDVIVEQGSFARMYLRVNGTGTFFRRFEPADFLAVDATYTGSVTSTGSDPMEWTASTVYVVRTSSGTYYKLGYFEAPGTGTISFTYAPIGAPPASFACDM